MKQLVALLALIIGCTLSARIAVLVSHGRREAARTARELVSIAGCVVLIGLPLLYASGSLTH